MLTNARRMRRAVRRPILTSLLPLLLTACSGGTDPRVEPLAILTTSLPSAGEHLAYDDTLQSEGGDGPQSWMVTSGALPPGIILDPSTGEISGIATALGTHGFTVQVQSGDGQTAQQALSLPVSALLGTIEWPFRDPLPKQSLPGAAVVEAFYNGFYNPPPCVNANTTLANVSVPWNSSGVTHRYDEDNDPGFVGFSQCMLNGTDEDLGLGVQQVSGWGVTESIALDTGAPDLAGKAIDFIQLVVDHIDRSGAAPNFEVVIQVRWLVYGQ